MYSVLLCLFIDIAARDLCHGPIRYCTSMCLLFNLYGVSLYIYYYFVDYCYNCFIIICYIVKSQLMKYLLNSTTKKDSTS